MFEVYKVCWKTRIGVILAFNDKGEKSIPLI